MRILLVGGELFGFDVIFGKLCWSRSRIYRHCSTLSQESHDEKNRQSSNHG